MTRAVKIRALIPADIAAKAKEPQHAWGSEITRCNEDEVEEGGG